MNASTLEGTPIQSLFQQLYAGHSHAGEAWKRLCATLEEAGKVRNPSLQRIDELRKRNPDWYLSEQWVGMSLYVDRFAGNLQHMRDKLGYLLHLGINLVHLMPLMETPDGKSDGGYAVSNCRNVNPALGTLNDLRELAEDMRSTNTLLMLDIVMNHTSEEHPWAKAARAGDPEYRDYYYFFPDRSIPDTYDAAMPEIFPHSAPGNFTWLEEEKQWVMTVFHEYQWDLNYHNPHVFVSMLSNVLFYANIGADILRIDAPAFLWKTPGTACQNQPEVHTLLQLLRHCVDAAAPGMALLAEAIVEPEAILPYFGEGKAECQMVYGATQMALQWDALATGDTRVMQYAQPLLLSKPDKCTWIHYTRCHDDIGLGINDAWIRAAGFEPQSHRQFLYDYYSGAYVGSPARGALFGQNPETGDARISGTLASLCGLESALQSPHMTAIDESIARIMVMQAHSFLRGGIPMLFYGDEQGTLNDYNFINDPGKSDDNRWMHRPMLAQRPVKPTRERRAAEDIYEQTRNLIKMRKRLPVLADRNNTYWLPEFNKHLAAFVRTGESNLLVLLNYSLHTMEVPWLLVYEHLGYSLNYKDHYQNKSWKLHGNEGWFQIGKYQVVVLEKTGED